MYHIIIDKYLIYNLFSKERLRLSPTSQDQFVDEEMAKETDAIGVAEYEKKKN